MLLLLRHTCITVILIEASEASVRRNVLFIALALSPPVSAQE